MINILANRTNMQSLMRQNIHNFLQCHANNCYKSNNNYNELTLLIGNQYFNQHW